MTITRWWSCTCTPFVAYGCGGCYQVWLHGLECQRPLERRRSETRKGRAA